MFSVILSLIPILLILVSYRKSKKYDTNVMSQLNVGYRCISCTEVIEKDKSLYTFIESQGFKINSPKVCKRCSRDIKLRKITNYKSSIIPRLKIWLNKTLIVSKRYSLLNILLTVQITVLILHLIVLYFYNIYYLNYIFNSNLILFWLLNIYRLELSDRSTEKPS